jgi:hypothetical protein
VKGIAVCALPLAMISAVAFGYPLDGYEETQMLRLEAYRLAQTGKVRGRLLPPGALLPGDGIRLRLLDRPDFQIPAPDAELQASILALLGEDADGYGLAVLDLTDPSRPRYAEHNSERPQNPGSVGKLMVALAWFQALADVYPDDTSRRHALMLDARHAADSFIIHDSHKVPFWQPGDPGVEQRPIRAGDEGNLWTWLDWMASSSSNAAASTVMSQLILLKHFGARYPVPRQEAERFFRDTPKSKLSRAFLDAIQTPISRNGMDLAKLRQGSFFTREGKSRVPGTNSVSTPLELMRFLVALEKGQLVDAYSSLEIKRLLYLTEKRIRYGASPALRRAALYFKSGSLYNCREEPGFECGKYRGNVRNFLNSTTIIETDEPGRQLHYIVVLLSNVLKKDSAAIHKQLATEIHRLMERDHSVGAEAGSSQADPSDAAPPDAAGSSFDEIDENDEIDEIDDGEAIEELDPPDGLSESADSR